MLSPSALQQRANQLKHRTPNKATPNRNSNSNNTNNNLTVNTAKHITGTEGMSHLEMIQFAGKLKQLRRTDIDRSPGGTPLRRKEGESVDDLDPFAKALFTKFKNTGLRPTKDRVSTGVTDSTWDT